MTTQRIAPVTWVPLAAIAACLAESSPRSTPDGIELPPPTTLSTTGCIASVTADDDDGNVAANVLDDDLGTRWSSYGEGSWLRAELVAPTDVCGVEIAWYRGDDRVAHFEVEASEDGSSWTQVHAGDSSGETIQRERYTFSATHASDIRIVVDGNTDNDWASITELGVVLCTDDPNVVAVTADDDDGNVAANVLDGDLGTRWSSYGKGSWIAADLGGVADIGAVEIAWYRGDQRSNDFSIEGSVDGTTWSLLHAGQSSGVTTQPEPYAVQATTARWIRITVDGNTDNDWASITELAVRGPAPQCGGGGGSDDGGGSDGGGSDTGGGGSDTGGGGCGDPAVDQNGVAYVELPGFSYLGGIERFDWTQNFKSSGSMRHDFEGAAEANQCVLGYFVVDGPADEEFSAKLGSGPHNDDHPSWADTHDVAISNFAGDRARIRWEATHPDYDNGPEVDIDIGDLRNQWVGAMGCKLNLDDDDDDVVDRIWYLAWVDPEGLDAQDNPNNGWIKTLDLKIDVDDVELESPEIPYVATIGQADEAQATLRIDEQDEDDYEYKYVTYRSPVPCEP